MSINDSRRPADSRQLGSGMTQTVIRARIWALGQELRRALEDKGCALHAPPCTCTDADPCHRKGPENLMASRRNCAGKVVANPLHVWRDWCESGESCVAFDARISARAPRIPFWTGSTSISLEGEPTRGGDQLGNVFAGTRTLAWALMSFPQGPRPMSRSLA